jgi:hypothetical protein
MSSSPDDNFDSLRKVLRVKRYEQPPPRYFNEFSGRVVSRIQSGDGRASWWERFGFDLRPAFAAGVGIVACGLVVYGVATTETGDEYSEAGGTSLANGSSALSVTPASSVAASSTNPVPSYGTPIDRNGFRTGALVPASLMR